MSLSPSLSLANPGHHHRVVGVCMALTPLALPLSFPLPMVALGKVFGETLTQLLPSSHAQEAVRTRQSLLREDKDEEIKKKTLVEAPGVS